MNETDRSQGTDGPDFRPIQLWVDTLQHEIGVYRRRKRNRILGRVAWVAILIAVWLLVGSNYGSMWWMWMLFGSGAAADIAVGTGRELATSLSESDDPR